MNIDAIVAGFEQALLWTTSVGDTDRSCLDAGYALDPTEHEWIVKQVTQWANTHAELISEEFLTRTPDDSYESSYGHDLFLTTQGHGAGFWDGDYVEPQGKLLTATAQAFPYFEPYEHKGVVYLSRNPD
jgi:hypothetical protein